MADCEESLVGAFVLLHDEVIEAVLWGFNRAEVLFVEIKDESRGHDTLVHETAASWKALIRGNDFRGKSFAVFCPSFGFLALMLSR